MIEALFKTFQMHPMIWWRRGSLDREELAIILGLGLAPLLAIKDLLHDDQNVWATAAVIFTVTIVAVTAMGAFCSLILKSWRSPRLDQAVAFGGLFAKTNLLLGLVFLAQKFELTPLYWSAGAEWLSSPTSFFSRLSFNLSCSIIPIAIVGGFGWAALEKRHKPLLARKGSWASTLVRREKQSFWFVLFAQLILCLLLLEFLLWVQLPVWLAPLSP